MSKFHPRSSKLNCQSNELDLSSILSTEIKSMRATQIKKILVENNIDTKGLFDKEDLAAVLLQLELSRRKSVSTLPLIDVTFADMKKTYKAINLIINNEKYLFMIDTGSSINLITKATRAKLSLNSSMQPTYTQGLGGGGTISAATVFIPEYSILNKKYSMEAIVLENASILPPNAAGLLGLSFLSQLGTVDFNFKEKTLSFGSSMNILSPLQKNNFHEINTRRIFSGLMVTDIFLNGQSTPCTGMIDLGSVYTIANTLAVSSVGVDLLSLPISSTMCAGVDGRPMKLRQLRLPGGVKIGKSNPNSISNANSPHTNDITIFAADIVGLTQIGLGNLPALIIGIDVLGNNRIIVDVNNNKIYLP
eukprot:gene5049-10114_t